MARIILDDLDDQVIERHRARAKARGVSLEQELRDVLTREAAPSRKEIVARLDRIRALTPKPQAGQRWMSAEELIREVRDSR
jgi:plasmid stability protein